jgi:hypothetical protein
LLAQNATQFFVAGVDVLLTFESDASGTTTSLDIAQGEIKQHATNIK